MRTFIIKSNYVPVEFRQSRVCPILFEHLARMPLSLLVDRRRLMHKKSEARIDAHHPNLLYIRWVGAMNHHKMKVAKSRGLLILHGDA